MNSIIAIRLSINSAIQIPVSLNFLEFDLKFGRLSIRGGQSTSYKFGFKRENPTYKHVGGTQCAGRTGDRVYGFCKDFSSKAE